MQTLLKPVALVLLLHIVIGDPNPPNHDPVGPDHCKSDDTCKAEREEFVKQEVDADKINDPKLCPLLRLYENCLKPKECSLPQILLDKCPSFISEEPLGEDKCRDPTTCQSEREKYENSKEPAKLANDPVLCPLMDSYVACLAPQKCLLLQMYFKDAQPSRTLLLLKQLIQHLVLLRLNLLLTILLLIQTILKAPLLMMEPAS
uniref:Uncharacterized protein n=1 Tax=Ditylenchus dipsaci TaxID=166011 RepID=A0A915EUZ3_9BILA